MKAIRVHQPGGPEALRYEEVPDPKPGPGQVLLDVEATGVNFIEIYQRTGLYQSPWPFTPGTEAAGVVAAFGEGVSEVAVGDRVASTSALGSYAARTLVAADRLVKLPDDLSWPQAAAALLQGMTAHYLACSTFPLEPGDTCLVHAAAGGVGLLLTQIAKRRGARVIGTVSTAAKAERARAAGADELILYREQDFAAETRRLTRDAGVQVVYDSVGRTTFESSLKTLAPRGMLVLYGGSSGPVPPFDPQVLNRSGSLFLTRPKLQDYVATKQELRDRAAEVLGWIQRGELKLTLECELPLSQAAEAHRLLESRATMGKLVLVPER
jgi:NADPH2:quinone reductase